MLVKHHITHLMDTITRGMKRIESKGLMTPLDKEQLSFVVQELRNAQKFSAPVNGLFFEDTNWGDYITPELKLPFPCIAVEYELEGKSATACCILAMDSTYARQIEIQDHPEIDGIIVIVSYFVNGVWQLIPTAGYIPYLQWQETANSLVPESTRKSMKPSATCMGFAPISAAWEKNFFKEGYSQEYMRKLIYADSLSVLQLINVLNCSNVSFESSPAPKFINAKRKAKGEHPLFEYKTLIVTGERTEHKDNTTTESKGDYTKRRQHMRRGHIRRYQTGKTIWINSMIVGDRSVGVIEKEYKLKRK